MYTLGPWRWESEGDRYWALKSPEDKTIIDDGSACGEYSQTIDPSGEDARLIAAAPDLLEACSFALEDGEIYRLSEYVKRQLREAITKAVGKREVG